MVGAVAHRIFLILHLILHSVFHAHLPDQSEAIRKCFAVRNEKIVPSILQL